MQYREQVVVFRKGDINHIARIITYVDIKKGKQPKLISLLTNDFDLPLETIVAIYRKRWQIESLFKQIKQNFSLKILLWRIRKCNKDINMGYINGKFIVFITSKLITKEMEFFWFGHNYTNYIDVLYKS